MTDFLLLESGEYLLLENEGKIILVIIPYTSIYDIKFASPSPILKLGNNNFIIRNLNSNNINITEAQ